MASSDGSEKKSTIAIFYPILTHAITSRELLSSSKLKEILIEGRNRLQALSLNLATNNHPYHHWVIDNIVYDRYTPLQRGHLSINKRKIEMLGLNIITVK